MPKTYFQIATFYSKARYQSKVPPSLQDVPSQHVLDQNDITFLDLVLAINDDDGSSDIDYVRYY